MLQDQINALEAREVAIQSNIENLESVLKGKKNELAVTRKAKKSLERYDEQIASLIPEPESNLPHQ